jgi:hypothetical protein
LINYHNYYLKRIAILLLQFYQMLFLYNVAFTLLVIFIFHELNIGELNAEVFISAKTTGFIAAIGLHYYVSKQTYFYFRNAGYKMLTIFIGAFAFDIVICILIIVLPSPLQHAAAYLKN